MWHRTVACWLAGAAFVLGASSASSATRVTSLRVDLAAKIDVAARKRERFAVDVPHSATLGDAGEWQRADGVSTWRYSVRIPTAVSMSFHAGEFKLPAGATLEAGGDDGAMHGYREADAHGALWSRPSRGDTLHFVLRVPTALESQAVLTLKSLQAGFRGLGGGVPNHPYFDKMQAASNPVFAACSENFACHATPANSHNADATAAIVIGGVALCTGTLINNTRSDGTPYLITARHCQDQPSSGITVYWDAASPCGTPLGSVYDIDAPAYNHTVDTVFEQQDVWMVRLGGPVNATRVYFAGWDVTGGAFVGGYSPHHSLGRSRQYAGWFGQAIPQTLPAATLGVGFDSTYWGVVNDVGNVGSGASGGGLFNADHHMVGVASLAYINPSTGEGVCPATPSVAPTSSNVTALYSSLAAVWESNADTTSSTNPVTLKSLLDPDNSGVRVLNGFQALDNVWISVDQSTLSTGSPATLTWNGGAATSCTAMGGVTGDGWAGTLAASGSRALTQFEAGDTNYSVRCTDGTRSASASVRVSWYQLPPNGFLSVDESSPYLGGSVRLVWRSNVTPCTATGGSAADGWAGAKAASGQQTITLTQAGAATYTLSCGSGARQFTTSAQIEVRPPVATLTALSNTMRVGSEVIIMQVAAGRSCARSGGVPGSNWTTQTGSFPFHVTSSTPGTFRFTLTCEGGSTPAVANLDITFTNDAPAAVLTASRSTAIAVPGGPIQDITGASPYSIDFSWVSNVAPCQLSYDGPGDHDGNVNPSMDYAGADTLSSLQEFPGIYEYRIKCQRGSDIAIGTATVEFLAQPPAVQVTGPEVVAANEQFQIGWYSNTAPCTATGGASGDGWAGSQGSSGGKFLTLTTPGTYVYTMTCGAGGAQVSDSFSVVLDPPAVQFLPHAAQVRAGVGIVLNWRSTVGPCTQTGEWANDAPHPAVGANVVVGAVGVRTYGIRCGTTNPVEATTQVTYLPRPVVSITASAPSVPVGQPVTLSWNSSNADTCEVQGAGSQDWEGPLPTAGSRAITRSSPGSVGFYINCGGEITAVVVEWRSVLTSPPRPASPTVTMTIDHATRVAGEAVSISWTTTHSAVCRGGQGVRGDAWAGTLPVSGTRSIIVNAAGTYTWDISCEGAPPSAQASVSAVYTAAPSGGSSSGGGSGSSSSGGGSGSGGGGGGRIDPLLLAMLGFMVMVAFARAGGRRKSGPGVGVVASSS